MAWALSTFGAFCQRARIRAPPGDATLTKRDVRVVELAIALHRHLDGIAIRWGLKVRECCRLLIAKILEAYFMSFREVRSVVDLILPGIQCKSMVASIVTSIDSGPCVRAERAVAFFNRMTDFNSSTKRDHHWQLLVKVLQLIWRLQVLILEHTIESLSSATTCDCSNTRSQTCSCKQRASS